jgi:hypothetical protein
LLLLFLLLHGFAIAVHVAITDTAVVAIIVVVGVVALVKD